MIAAECDLAKPIEACASRVDLEGTPFTTRAPIRRQGTRAGYRAIIDPTHQGFVAVLSASLVMVP